MVHATLISKLKFQALGAGTLGLLLGGLTVDVVTAHTIDAIAHLGTYPHLNQITSVSQLADGQPTDWVFQSLQALVEGYMAVLRVIQMPPFGAIAQLEVSPTITVDLGLTYVRAYYPGGELFVSGGTGRRLANVPFGPIATSSNQFSFQSSWRINSQLTLSSWAGLSLANAEVDSLNASEGDDTTIFNWAVTLAMFDVGKEGKSTGLVVGQPPRVLHNDAGPGDGAPAWHLEGFYRYQINDNISLIPCLIVIINPEHNSDNSTIFGGNLRTVEQCSGFDLSWMRRNGDGFSSVEAVSWLSGTVGIASNTWHQ